MRISNFFHWWCAIDNHFVSFRNTRLSLWFDYKILYSFLLSFNSLRPWSLGLRKASLPAKWWGWDQTEERTANLFRNRLQLLIPTVSNEPIPISYCGRIACWCRRLCCTICRQRGRLKPWSSKLCSDCSSLFAQDPLVHDSGTRCAFSHVGCNIIEVQEQRRLRWTDVWERET